MTDLQLIAVVGYPLLGLLSWRLEYHRRATAARNYLILAPLSGLVFIGLAWLLMGFLSSFVLLLVAGSTLLNALSVRFCANCGALQRRRSWFAGPECQECQGTDFVHLWTALRLARARTPTA